MHRGGRLLLLLPPLLLLLMMMLLLLLLLLLAMMLLLLLLLLLQLQQQLLPRKPPFEVGCRSRPGQHTDAPSKATSRRDECLRGRHGEPRPIAAVVGEQRRGALLDLGKRVAAHGDKLGSARLLHQHVGGKPRRVVVL